jgi:alpha-galactosidase
MRFRSLIRPALLLAAMAALLPAQSDITGFWVFRVPTGDGNFRDTFFDLKQDGRTVTGKRAGDRETPIANGTFENRTLRFEVPMRSQGQTRSTVYEAAITGRTIVMTVTNAGREPVKGTLERSKPEAALPPPRLPLPELHDVRDNGLARTPPMGWNSWNLFAGRIDDKTVREMADAMISSGMKKAGYVYINIDDTWEGQRDAQGNITTNTKFPNMKALADYVHSKGLKIGLYSSPGPKTCANYEGSYGHEEQDAKTWAAWGFDYIKYDWCSAGRIYKNEDEQAAYQKMGDALLKTGRPIVYSLCQYGAADVWKWGAKVGGNLWRTTGDISDNWRSMENIGFKQVDISPFTRVGHWNDPDMLEIGNGHMTGDEYRVHMSLWSLLAAPLLAGNDLRNMTDETKSILMNAEVIAIDQDAAAKPVKRISQEGKSEVWVRELKDRSVAVALFNRDDKAADIGVSLASLNLAGKKFAARDLWKHQPVTVSGERYSASVPAHGVVLLKVSAR